MKEWIKKEKMKEKLRMKWDRQQSTDNEERGKEKEQEESCMMQTCDKKLQKQGKAAASLC